MVDLPIDHLHAAEVGHADRLSGVIAAGDVSHHHPFDILRSAKPRHPSHQVDLRALLERAGGDIDIFGHEPALDLAQRDAKGVEAVAVQQHPDFLLAAPRDPHFGDPGQLFETGRYLPPRQPAQLGQIGPALRGHQPQREDRRLSGIEPTDQYLVDVGVGAHRTDGLLDIDQAQIQIGIPVEHHGRHQSSGARDLRHLSNATDREQALFDLLAVETLHLSWGGGRRNGRRRQRWGFADPAGGRPAAAATPASRRGPRLRRRR